MIILAFHHNHISIAEFRSTILGKKEWLSFKAAPLTDDIYWHGLVRDTAPLIKILDTKRDHADTIVIVPALQATLTHTDFHHAWNRSELEELVPQRLPVKKASYELWHHTAQNMTTLLAMEHSILRPFQQIAKSFQKSRVLVLPPQLLLQALMQSHPATHLIQPLHDYTSVLSFLPHGHLAEFLVNTEEFGSLFRTGSKQNGHTHVWTTFDPEPKSLHTLFANQEIPNRFEPTSLPKLASSMGVKIPQSAIERADHGSLHLAVLHTEAHWKQWNFLNHTKEFGLVSD